MTHFPNSIAIVFVFEYKRENHTEYNNTSLLFQKRLKIPIPIYATFLLKRLSILIKFNMRRLYFFLFACFITTNSFCQTERKLSTFLLTQYNGTINDYTKGNNPWSIGLGLQAFYNNKTKLKPTIEFTADAYLEDDKLLRSDPDGSFPENGNDVRGMLNLMVGSSFHPTKDIYVSFVAGPSFINGNTFLGIKPSFGFFFSKNKMWMGKVSYINIFDRTALIKEDFSSFSVAIGRKLL